jgi:hypothetical protein
MECGGKGGMQHTPMRYGADDKHRAARANDVLEHTRK